METETLDEILNSEPSEPAQEEAAPTDEEAQPAEEAKAEDAPVEGEQDAKGEEDAPPASKDEPAAVPITALLDEREKRQAAERELAGLREAKQQPARPDVLEDPEGAITHVEESLRAENATKFLQMSEFMAREAHPEDFDETIDAFAEAVKADPSLQQRMIDHPHPGEFAYQQGKNFRQLNDAGGLEALIAKARAEGAAEAEAKIKKQQSETEETRSSLTTSLADERNVGSRSGPEWSGPTALEDMVSNTDGS